MGTHLQHIIRGRIFWKFFGLVFLTDQYRSKERGPCSEMLASPGLVFIFMCHFAASEDLYYIIKSSGVPKQDLEDSLVRLENSINTQYEALYGTSPVHVTRLPSPAERAELEFQKRNSKSMDLHQLIELVLSHHQDPQKNALNKHD